MTFEELFNDPLFVLPKEIPKISNYAKYIKKIFEQYLNLLSEVTDLKNVKGLLSSVTISRTMERQEEFLNGITDAIDLYYAGKPSEAYLALADTISNRVAKNKSMIRIGEYEIGESFYRSRIGTDNFLYKKNQMFHIPFELRGNVATQRYSIPGFPSLYLGKTIYVCWEELKRPDLNIFQVSKLENTDVVTYIDLTPPDFTSGLYNTKVFGYLMAWPLIAACSLKVSNPNSHFKPEYIIPQLLLQWVRNENEVDGIKYNSTNIPAKTIRSDGEFHNLVFLLKKMPPKGYALSFLACSAYLIPYLGNQSRLPLAVIINCQ
ncbi:hypothetical protein DHW03_15485 [Pedobacter yonginense]|uniref:Uncharacterized protein n=1 Tax=Pedobacter yonginense TaxID=651869 RepID=A0A317EIM4_9SPHI|nr:RES domain-containing protein [Pedobacter yonginense]PWS26195.1 hypothetical protein DHW03_15485 [Pedobacter yonginense]